MFCYQQSSNVVVFGEATYERTEKNEKCPANKKLLVLPKKIKSHMEFQFEKSLSYQESNRMIASTMTLAPAANAEGSAHSSGA